MLRNTMYAGLIAGCMLNNNVHADIGGYLGVEGRHFGQKADYNDSAPDSGSLLLQPEYYAKSDDGRYNFSLIGFYRQDQLDDQRSHGDFRELNLAYVADSWTLNTGIRKVFWGVTESQHLVDIINQTDLVEDPDGEQKLGQPMVNLVYLSEYGNLEAYLLPMFRERTFPGADGRLGLPLPVDDSLTHYQSSREQYNPDVALRWSYALDDGDIALTWFDGTARTPQLQLAFNEKGQPVLAPYYPLIKQVGLELQAVTGNTLWKLEAIHVHLTDEDYQAVTAGLEHTLAGFFDTGWDVGLLLEGLYDSRGDEAPTPMQRDLFAGMRLNLNDTQGSQLLAGVIADTEEDGWLYSIEVSRRLGENWKLNGRWRGYENFADDSAFAFLNKEDYLQLELLYYF